MQAVASADLVAARKAPLAERRAMKAGTINQAAEMQGLYGPFTFPERLLQEIWRRGDFDVSRAKTIDGRTVRVVHPGRWNSLGGPDFLGARLSFEGGAIVTTDVELHLHAADWAAHRHAADPAYRGVGLHVVLFPPPAGHETQGANGESIPVLVLLPLLLHDLEEYAAEAVVERLARRPASMIGEALGPMEPAALRELLVRQAGERWRLKAHFARLRLQRLGWTEACHQTALEILGLRYNRAPMLRVATRWPLVAWQAENFDLDEVFAAEPRAWTVQGVRPANHPRRRLRQYAAWVRARHDWPAILAEEGRDLAKMGPETVLEWSAAGGARFRKTHRLGEWRLRWAGRIAAETVGGTRFDTLVCDGFLPLLGAREAPATAEAFWFHWYPGDLPPLVGRALRQLGVFGPEQPSAQGFAQGLLGWLIERERAGGGL